MPMTRQQKDDLIASMSSVRDEAQLIVLTGFEGIDVSTDTEIRNNLRSTGAKYRVIKNTLAKKVLGDEYEGLFPEMKGMTGYVFGIDDPVATAKVVVKAAKDHEKMFTVKGGYFEGQVLSKDDVVALSKVPSREELLTRLASALQSPIQKIANVLQAPIQKFAGTLQALADKRGEEAA